MRSLISARLAVALAGLCVCVGTFASDELPKIPPAHFSMRIHGRSSERVVIVYRDQKDWICATESLAYFVARENPLAGLDWTALAKDAKAHPPVNCRDQVTIEDKLSQGHAPLTSCLKTPSFSALNHRLNQLCRAE